MDTESRLRDWRLGQTIAERLCAGLLRISGYMDVDPQSPLGGPDGKKDIVAWRNNKKYIAACYFPPTPVGIAKIIRKYQNDLEGVAANAADGFLFFVNQPLTVGQRRDLLALGNPQVDQIIHLERMRNELDSPRGYGLRLEHLHIPMSQEEQVSYFNTLQQDTLQRLLRNEAEELLNVDPSAISRLDLSLLQTLHEVMFRFAEPTTASAIDEGPLRALGGRLRAVNLHVASSKGEVIYVAPKPELVRKAIVDHLTWWRAAYTEALAADLEERMLILARLHHGIISIMPFTDGNGRIARLVTHFAARDLLGEGVAIDLTSDRLVYYRAVSTADGGNLNELVELIRAALVPVR